MKGIFSTYFAPFAPNSHQGLKGLKSVKNNKIIKHKEKGQILPLSLVDCFFYLVNSEFK